MEKRYEKIEFTSFCDIKESVKELLSYKDKGILACGSFNGTTLYSDTVTLDSAYKDITGKTKAEFDNAQQEMSDRINKEKQAYKQAIPELSKDWMSKGRKILTEDKWKYWDETIPISLNGLYRGMELGACLDIIKILNDNGTLDEAKEKIESQGNSKGLFFRLVCSMVKEFCVRGSEFLNYVR
ncbi:hypothetical protein [Clostridium akagii]|uniref:hypothetical protein n=1 Tax=Clostridium akagii TaxID=91623 RepID=UPI00047DDD70|nr:hypothetical protein [Clostridium akagii]